MYGVILYGAPAAGKDTITRALCQIDSRYRPFARLKAGTGRTAGYRMTTEAELDDLRARDEVVWENRRYDAVYVVDRSMLAEQLTTHVPVMHLGQVEAIDAVIQATPQGLWLIVYLWCPREVAAERLAARGSTDLDARLAAWDETEPPAHADLTLNTASIVPEQAAQAIHHRLSRVPLLCPGSMRWAPSARNTSKITWTSCTER